MTTESLAAMAKMSAHETTPGQAFSTTVFIWSITSNPRSESLFGIAFFSPVKVDVSSSKTDPSHPYIRNKHIIKQKVSWIKTIIPQYTIILTLTKQSWKNIRRIEAPILASLLIADCITDFTVENRFGQEVE